MNFNLQPVSEISSLAIEMGFFDFTSLCNFVDSLPPIPISEHGKYQLVLLEKSGTNADKHGFLACVLEAHKVEDIHLMVGILLVNREKLIAIDPAFNVFERPNIPISLSYFRYNGKRISFSGNAWDIQNLEKFIVREQRCEPKQMVNWKPMIYENYLDNLLKRSQLTSNDHKLLILLKLNY